MAEEHRLQPPVPCVNNCGFSGSPATQGLCSKCYTHLHMNQQQQSSSSSVMALTSALASPSNPSFPPASPSVSDSLPCPSSSPACPVPTIATPPQSGSHQPNRCSSCRRRVGLTGFKCRCGLTYCGTHRYPEQHDCAFDFKAMGREQLAKANPLVVAPKLDKI